MSDWQVEQRRRQGEHIDDLSEPISRAKEVKGGLKSFFIGDTPSEMAFNAATLGLLPMAGVGRAAKLALGGLSAMTAADDAEGITLLPAKQLKGALGDIARQVQDYVGYAAQRGLPLSNEALFFHEQVPFYISPSSGKLMAINPEIAKLARLPKKLSDSAPVKDVIHPALTELVPKVENTLVRPAEDVESLMMVLRGISGSYAPEAMMRARTGGPHPAQITLADPKLSPETLVHELMHDIQHKYGLSTPGVYDTSTAAGMKGYRKDWGEREARAAERVLQDMLNFDAPVSRLPGYARSPRINIDGTNLQGMQKGSEEGAVLEALQRGAKEMPWTR